MVIKIRTMKFCYAFEIKTNFEDEFDKFTKEEKLIYHHRKKVFKNFKYYYLSLNLPSNKFKKELKDSIKTLIDHKEIYVLNKKNTEFPWVVNF